MRYKILVQSNMNYMIVSYMIDYNMVTVRDRKIIGYEPYPFPHCLATSKEKPKPADVQCYKTADGIIFDDCGSGGFRYWFYIPETHPMFNIDLLYKERVVGTVIQSKFKLALREASRVIIKAVETAVKNKMKQ